MPPSPIAYSPTGLLLLPSFVTTPRRRPTYATPGSGEVWVRFGRFSNTSARWAYDGESWWLVPHHHLTKEIRSTFPAAFARLAYDSAAGSFEATIFASTGGGYTFTGPALSIEQAGDALLKEMTKVAYNPPRVMGFDGMSSQPATDISPPAQRDLNVNPYTVEWQERFAGAINAYVLGGDRRHLEDTTRRFLNGGSAHVWRDPEQHVAARNRDVERWADLLAEGGVPAIRAEFTPEMADRWGVDVVTAKMLLTLGEDPDPSEV